MKTRELKALAVDASDLMAGAATKAFIRLSEKRNEKYTYLLPILSTIAVRLMEVKLILERPLLDQEASVNSRLPGLLAQLERVCEWPKKQAESSNHFPFLQTVTNRSRGRSSPTGDDELCKAITSFAMNGRGRVAAFISNLETFASIESPEAKSQRPGVSNGYMADKLFESPYEYSAEVHTVLYETLSKNLQCTCITADNARSSPWEHWARLRLTAEVRQAQGHVLFDMVFSAVPGNQRRRNSCWQQLRLHVPSTVPKRVNTKPKKSIRFADNDAGVHNPNTPNNREVYEPVHPERFCKLLQHDIGPVCIPLKVIDGCLHEARNIEQPNQRVAKADSVPLSEILRDRHLPPMEKILLAFTLAKAVWRYYSSDFMKAPWTTESVHFMQEERGKVCHSKRKPTGASIDTAKPCFAFSHFVSESPEPDEHCRNGQVFHRYPRVLALGVLLVAIAQDGTPPHHSKESSFEKRVNEDFMYCRDIAQCKSWPELNLQNKEFGDRYRAAVNNCFDHKLFDLSSTDGDQDPAELELKRRRDALYTYVLLPLQRLCEDCGVIDNPDIGRLDLPQTNHVGAEGLPATGLLANTSQNINSADTWMATIANSSLTNHILKSYRENRNLKRTRIAVLDTGYDPKSAFFQARPRDLRIREWKDLVRGQAERMDSDGHGTHVLSLAMKIAPGADVCVARVASSTEDLAQSATHIADAIEWATDPERGNADIVSMSFGFVQEPHVEGIPVISNAIHKAILNRHGRVLFFAATANDGANQPEMFPARHLNVIPIRATDHLGSFQNFNPAQESSEPYMFGTLGTNVPGAGLSTRDGEVRETGVSMATPIAAGIAAMILLYARLVLGQKDQSLDVEKLETMAGMRSVLKKLSTKVTDRHYYIYPHRFLLEMKDSERNALLIDALRIA